MKTKKQIRDEFRRSVFERDQHRCRICFRTSKEVKLDAHHIIDRKSIANGGYVKENGISLCPAHHLKAEEFHKTGQAEEGFWPDDLFTLIHSSEALAREAAEKL